MTFISRFATLCWDAINRMLWNVGFELAGYIAFTALFAIFPFLIFLAALASFLGEGETANTFIDGMFDFMPDDVAATLAPAVREVLEGRQGGLMTFGILVTLYYTSNAVEAMRSSLNRAYAVPDTRPIWYTRLQSLGFVVVGGLVVFLLSLSVILGPAIWTFLDRFMFLSANERVVYTIGRYVLAITLLLGSLLAMHLWLPNLRQEVRLVLPGVVLTVVLWLLGASLFSLYLGIAADYSATYGSLGGVVITLFFFYLTAVIFVFGAEFNAAWRHRPAVGEEGHPDTA